MKFLARLPLDENFSVLRMQSEQGLWELGMRQMMFGVRISLMRTTDFWYTLDYCAADDKVFLLQLYVVLSIILDRFPETIDPSELRRHFPGFQYKPIKYDLCWGQLYQMAYEQELPYRICSRCQMVNYEIGKIACPTCNHVYEQSPIIDSEFERSPS